MSQNCEKMKKESNQLSLDPWWIAFPLDTHDYNRQCF